MNFLDIESIGARGLSEILLYARADLDQVLLGRGVALVFEKPSLRTRNSSEMAVVSLGGHPIYITNTEVGLDSRESAQDIARSLASYHAVIAARVFDHSVLVRMARSLDGTGVPIVNLLSDRGHPCQAVADLLTMIDRFGEISGLEVSYVGDSNNVTLSLAQACLLLGAHLRIASPEGFGFDAQTRSALELMGKVEFTQEPDEAVRGADVVYTDTWTSMGQEAEAQVRRSVFSPRYQVDSQLMALAHKDAIFMHCLPAHRGEEVSEEVFESRQSVVFSQAANRLSAFRAILYAVVTN